MEEMSIASTTGYFVFTCRRVDIDNITLYPFDTEYLRVYVVPYNDD